MDAVDKGSTGDIVAQVYRFQVYLLHKDVELVGSEPAIAHANSMSNILTTTNEMRAVQTERGQSSDQGRDFVTLAFRDAMAAARR
ncbi:hypothetical protein ABID19_006916 [Mesorhizobium robiniae]|uniref:Uncharacterized protein n=1 Tax=Mesorhizobium robiniae TaxID=559315 RepID=A0ABV2GZY7_9HYPH